VSGPPIEEMEFCPVDWGGDNGTVIAATVSGNHVDGSPGMRSEDGVGVWGSVDSDEKKLTVTTGPGKGPELPGAVITVDQIPGLTEAGTVTVSTSVAVLLGPSGTVTVSTEPAEVPSGAGTVTVTPDVGAAGTTGIVMVAPEPGMPGDSGIVTVMNDAAELPFPPGPAREAPGTFPEG
jgi:hypothetical protein